MDAFSGHKKSALIAVVFAIMIFCRITNAAPPAEYLYDSVFIEINDDYTAEILFKKRIQFNQPRVDKYSIIRVPVNQHIDFNLVETVTRLPDGRKLELDKDDIETISDFTPRYYPESKTKIIYIPLPRTGAVSDVVYSLTYKSLLYLPRFFRQSDIPAYDSYLEVKSKIPYSYYLSPDLEASFNEDSSLVVYSPNIPALEPSSRMPPNENFQIVIKPDSAIYMKKKYGFSTWADVANFYNELSASGSDGAIHSAIESLADSLPAEASTRNDSLAALLDFVLNNIRYISVDIGRGEFKPLDPPQVLGKRFGDCKDQSALLVSLCRAVGFDANPALMTTRDNPDIIITHPWPGFFNHVITAVDTGNGYLFLDASQPTCCFGNLPFSLRNRRALVCGKSPFLEFTLTSPFEQGNDINIELVYELINSRDLRVEIGLEIFKDPAHIFHSKSLEQTLSNVLFAFFDEEIISRYRNNFRLQENQSDYIRVTGNLFEKLTETRTGNRILINTQSPYMRLLKKYFVLPQRIHTYEFDFAFNINEQTTFALTDDYTADKDSLVLTFNERGLTAELSVISNERKCEINKKYRLFNYTLSPDRYNRFVDFLLIASQITYNSIEIISNED